MEGFFIQKGACHPTKNLKTYRRSKSFLAVIYILAKLPGIIPGIETSSLIHTLLVIAVTIILYNIISGKKAI